MVSPPTAVTGSAILATAAEHRSDPGLQLTGAEWLDQIVVGTRIEGPDDLVLHTTGGGHDHRHRADRTDHLEQLEPIEIGKPEVEDHQVGCTLYRRFEALHGGCCRDHVVAMAGEHPSHQIAYLQVVFDETPRRPSSSGYRRGSL